MAGTEDVNPPILIWARQTAGLSLQSAAKKLAISEDTLSLIECGKKLPSRAQVQKFSHVYRRSAIVFYLEKPPEQSKKAHDFRSRTLEYHSEQDARLNALLRDVKSRQAILKGLLEDEEEAEPRTFVASMSVEDGVQALVSSISATLGFTPGATHKKPEELFKALRKRSEAIGVFVILIGDLGSHHTAIDPEVFRGFAVADPIAPLVAINDRDAAIARPFTLLHELAHIWIGASGVSGLPQHATIDKTDEARIEQFCNDVAAACLLPSEVLAKYSPASSIEQARDLIRRVATKFGISEPMVAYNAQRANIITVPAYKKLCAEYAARWRAAKEAKKGKEEEDSRGPHPHIVKRSKLGDGIVDLVRRGINDRALSPTKAAKVLGLNPVAVEGFIQGTYLTQSKRSDAQEG